MTANFEMAGLPSPDKGTMRPPSKRRSPLITHIDGIETTNSRVFVPFRSDSSEQQP